MEGSGAAFALGIGDWADKIGVAADLVFRDVLLTVASRTILATPVGDPSMWKNAPKSGNPRNALGAGMLRANWQLGAGAVPSGVNTVPDPSGSATIGNLSAQVANGSFKAGTIAYLANNLVYTLPIEYGAGDNPYAPNSGWHGSKQAPAGMLRTSVMQYEMEFTKRVEAL